MPEEVTGFLGFGRYHQIEVEDDATLYFRYKDGKNATFITSTGETPGVNRLEVISERGVLTVDDGMILWDRNETQSSNFSLESMSGFSKPDAWKVKIPIEGRGGQHIEIMQNFINSILHGEELISPAVEGIHSVELANAALLSAWEGNTIQLPMPSEKYSATLKEKGDKSTFEKKKIDAKATASADDFAQSNKT
tara:strand:- start:492 stop:1073 length:582 start_codon:yes stop_codon:yes gene_type:complete